MSGPELSPLEVLRFDWSEVDSRYGLPRALADKRALPIFSVPAHFVPAVLLDTALWRYGRELALCSLAWNRRFYLAEDGNGAHPDAMRGGFPDLPQLVRICFRRDVGDAEWAFLADLDRALAHAVTSPGVGPCRALRVADLDSLSQAETERRIFAILRGEEVAPLGFVDQSEGESATSGAA